MSKDEALKMAMYELEIVGLKDGDTYNACKEALEQPAQEPVAWMYKRADGSAVLQFDRAKSTYGVIEVPLYEGVNND